MWCQMAHAPHMELLMKILHVSAFLVPLAVVACADEGDTSSRSDDVVDCPTLSPPAPGFCPDGVVAPRREQGCIVGYECVVECPSLSPPAPGFCAPGDRIVPVKDEASDCTIGYECKPECPMLSPPGPGFCDGGAYAPIIDEDGCTTGFSCT
jgi:hypothetical protein